MQRPPPPLRCASFDPPTRMRQATLPPAPAAVPDGPAPPRLLSGPLPGTVTAIADPPPSGPPSPPDHEPARRPPQQPNHHRRHSPSRYPDPLPHHLPLPPTHLRPSAFHPPPPPPPRPLSSAPYAQLTTDAHNRVCAWSAGREGGSPLCGARWRRGSAPGSSPPPGGPPAPLLSARAGILSPLQAGAQGGAALGDAAVDLGVRPGLVGGDLAVAEAMSE